MVTSCGLFLNDLYYDARIQKHQLFELLMPENWQLLNSLCIFESIDDKQNLKFVIHIPS
jgi:hypothetical protein